MAYEYEKEIHQVRREGNDSVTETIYSHAVNNLLCIQREGHYLTFTVVDNDSKKVLAVATAILEVDK